MVSLLKKHPVPSIRGVFVMVARLRASIRRRKDAGGSGFCFSWWLMRVSLCFFPFLLLLVSFWFPSKMKSTSSSRLLSFLFRGAGNLERPTMVDVGVRSPCEPNGAALALSLRKRFFVRKLQHFVVRFCCTTDS